MGAIAHNNKHFEVAPHLSPVFTGQGHIGKRLETAFTPSEYKCPFQRRFVLFGMGGAGKTQICLRYANNYQERYKNVCFSLTDEL
jgi:signal recognition particle GTPase